MILWYSYGVISSIATLGSPYVYFGTVLLSGIYTVFWKIIFIGACVSIILGLIKSNYFTKYSINIWESLLIFISLLNFGSILFYQKEMAIIFRLVHPDILNMTFDQIVYSIFLGFGIPVSLSSAILLYNNLSRRLYNRSI